MISGEGGLKERGDPKISYGQFLHCRGWGGRQQKGTRGLAPLERENRYSE